MPRSYRPKSAKLSISAQLLHGNVQWFRGRLVFKAQAFVSLKSSLESNKGEEAEG